MNWDDIEAERRYRAVKLRNKSKKLCGVCKSYLYICQLGLKDWGFKTIKPVKNLNLNQKIANCPHNCVNSPDGCLDCYNFEKFEMKVGM